MWYYIHSDIWLQLHSTLIEFRQDEALSYKGAKIIKVLIEPTTSDQQALCKNMAIVGDICTL